MKNQKGFILPIIVAVVAVIILTTGGYFAYKQYSAPKPIACTQEAKICPDGSSVGRTGPKCEFVECPAVVDQTAGWKTYKNDEYGFEVKYPNKWYFKEIERGIVEGGIYFSQYLPEGESGGIAFTNESLSVSINQSAPQVSLLKFVENYLNLSASMKFEIENIKIDGIDAIKIKVICDGVGCGNPHWFVIKNNNVYIFSSGLSNKNEIDTYEKMLSTFKFTK